jgi:hypothetical protein
VRQGSGRPAAQHLTCCHSHSNACTLFATSSRQTSLSGPPSSPQFASWGVYQLQVAVSLLLLPVLLPVLLPAEPILLDGLLQAVTLKSGDVVAVRTAARPLPTYFGCFEHQMQLNPKHIHRPVLAATVQVRCCGGCVCDGGVCRGSLASSVCVLH